MVRASGLLHLLLRSLIRACSHNGRLFIGWMDAATCCGLGLVLAVECHRIICYRIS